MRAAEGWGWGDGAMIMIGCPAPIPRRPRHMIGLSLIASGQHRSIGHAQRTDREIGDVAEFAFFDLSPVPGLAVNLCTSHT